MMRCLTLAEVLRSRGIRVTFICRDHIGNLANLARDRGFAVGLLPCSEDAESGLSDTGHVTWLGASQSDDAKQTASAIGINPVDWMIVDHYSIGVEWQGRVRSLANNLLVIDDLADRTHDCDILVDQNFSSSTIRYESLVPGTCRRLLGPQFAMLRPEYRQMRDNTSQDSSAATRMLIFFGGSDPHNLTGMALSVMSRPEFSAIEVDLVIGVNNPHRRGIEDVASHRPSTRLHGPRAHLADLMSEADIAIGAGGVTTWERMCMGLPSIVISIADNQLSSCQALAAEGLIDYLGHCSEVNVSDLSGAIRDRLGQPRELREVVARNKLTVDGWGAERVVECMIASSADSLRLRPATEADVFQYFSWANDPTVRAQSIQSDPIRFADHCLWFSRKLREASCRLFVMLAKELPVGQIRFDREGHEERIDYSIDALYRGRGWGSRLVEMGMTHVGRGPNLVFLAEVKRMNEASARVFASLGFEETPALHGGELRSFRLAGNKKAVSKAIK